LVHSLLELVSLDIIMAWYSNSEGRYGESGRKGDLGEQIVEDYLTRNQIPYDRKTDIISQVHRKIDFIIDGVLVDVKANVKPGWYSSELTHAVEVLDDDGNDGWIYSSEAEEIYAVCLKTKDIYKYKTKLMREVIPANARQLYWITVDNKLFTKLADVGELVDPRDLKSLSR